MTWCIWLPLPAQFVLCTLAGLVSREQQKVIDYLRAENRVLREQLASMTVGYRRVRRTSA